MTAQILSPVPGSIQSLVQLFQDELSGVKFPDVDADVLEKAVEKVRSASIALAEAEAIVEAAREQLTDAQEALFHKGQRALAYARVFAEEDAALAAKLDSLALPRTQRKIRNELTSGEVQQPKRRGRPPKSASAPLFNDGVTVVADERAEEEVSAAAN